LPDGTTHADPFLASRGRQAQGGVYIRVPQGDPRQADMAFTDDFAGLTRAEQIVLVQAVARDTATS
jgi:hypothetical protein